MSTTNWRGEIVSLHLTGEGTESQAPLSELHLMPGKSFWRFLLGNLPLNKRYNHVINQLPGPSRVTLVEVEVVEALENWYQMALEPRDTLRNIVTRNVPLSSLIGERFRMGEIIVRGVSLCQPFPDLDVLIQEGLPDELKYLISRGGLVAEVRTEGTVRVEDQVHPC